MNLFHYPRRGDRGDYLMTALEADQIKDMLAFMTPDNMRITLVARS